MTRQTTLMLTFFLLLAIAGVAWGTGKQPPPSEPQIFSQEQIQSTIAKQEQAQKQAQTNAQDQQQGITDNSVINPSQSTTHNDDSMFFALSTNVPEVADCVISKQVGGFGDNGGGIFTWGNISIPCFLDKVAEAEKSVGIRARLKCGIRSYRRSVAYDSPNKTKQADCVAYVENEWRTGLDITGTRQRLEQQLAEQTERVVRMQSLLDESVGMKK